MHAHIRSDAIIEDLSPVLDSWAVFLLELRASVATDTKVYIPHSRWIRAVRTAGKVIFDEDCTSSAALCGNEHVTPLNIA